MTEAVLDSDECGSDSEIEIGEEAFDSNDSDIEVDDQSRIDEVNSFLNFKYVTFRKRNSARMKNKMMKMMKMMKRRRMRAIVKLRKRWKKLRRLQSGVLSPKKRRCQERESIS